VAATLGAIAAGIGGAISAGAGAAGAGAAAFGSGAAALGSGALGGLGSIASGIGAFGSSALGTLGGLGSTALGGLQGLGGAALGGLQSIPGLLSQGLGGLGSIAQQGLGGLQGLSSLLGGPFGGGPQQGGGAGDPFGGLLGFTEGEHDIINQIIGQRSNPLGAAGDLIQSGIGGIASLLGGGGGGGGSAPSVLTGQDAVDQANAQRGSIGEPPLTSEGERIVREGAQAQAEGLVEHRPGQPPPPGSVQDRGGPPTDFLRTLSSFLSGSEADLAQTQQPARAQQPSVAPGGRFIPPGGADPLAALAQLIQQTGTPIGRGLNF